ncbi:MAG: alpha/beta hydrolase [Candidatus Micrarchaeota archaeon]
MRALHAEKAQEWYPKERFRTSQGVELEYIYMPQARRSNPRTLVFINGWCLRHSEWKAQMHRFPGCNLLFFNLRGHGNSELGSSTPSTFLGDCAQDTAELMAHLGLGRVTLVMHSMGTLIGTLVAAGRANLGGSRFPVLSSGTGNWEQDGGNPQVSASYRRANFPEGKWRPFSQQRKSGSDMETGNHFSLPAGPEIDSMVMVSPVPGNPLNALPYRWVLGPGVEYALKNPWSAEAARWYARNFRSDAFVFPSYLYFKAATWSGASLETYRKFMESILDMKNGTFLTAFRAMVENGDEVGERMRGLQIPVLAVTGSGDFLVSPSSLEILRERIPRIETKIFWFATHFPHAERPEEFNRLVAEFVEKIDAGK